MIETAWNRKQSHDFAQYLFWAVSWSSHTVRRLRHHESNRNIWDTANHLDRSSQEKACTVISSSVCQVATDPSTSAISSRFEWRDCLAGLMETINNHKIREKRYWGSWKMLKVFEIAWNGFNCHCVSIINSIYSIYISKSVGDCWYLLAEKLALAKTGEAWFPFPSRFFNC